MPKEFCPNINKCGWNHQNLIFPLDIYLHIITCLWYIYRSFSLSSFQTPTASAPWGPLAPSSAKSRNTAPCCTANSRCSRAPQQKSLGELQSATVFPVNFQKKEWGKAIIAGQYHIKCNQKVASMIFTMTYIYRCKLPPWHMHSFNICRWFNKFQTDLTTPPLPLFFHT